MNANLIIQQNPIDNFKENRVQELQSPFDVFVIKIQDGSGHFIVVVIYNLLMPSTRYSPTCLE